MKFLVYGHKGWIGKQVVDIILKQNTCNVVHVGTARVDDVPSVTYEIQHWAPDRVLCLVGRTHGEGYSTIDYLEQPGKLRENINDNLYAPISLALTCQQLGIHMTYLGTGCIFTDEVPEDTEGYTEQSLPNFFGSGYSTVKGFTDRLMHQMPNVLNVRIRMPIVDYHCERNFITKITKYAKVINVQNSMTVLPELLPLMVDLCAKQHCGTINLTNPGTMSHNEILELYQTHVDPEFTWQNFSLEEQDKILASKRSNNMLQTHKLEALYPGVKDLRTSLIQIFKKYQ